MVLNYLEIMAVVVAVVAATYVTLSYILLKFPHLLHKRKNIKFLAKHISHRGGAGENIENTMGAFKHAISMGTDMLEIDCQITKDGEVVVSHDNHLQRQSAMDACISDLALMELPKLQKEPIVETISTQTRQSYCSDCDCQIPLLRHVFETFPDLPLNIDIKRNDDQLIQKVSSLITEFKREDITAWGNVSGIITEKLYKQNPSVPLIFSFRRALKIFFLYYTGLLPFLAIKESFLEIPMPSILLSSQNFGTFSTKTKLLIRFVDKVIMRPSLFRHLRHRGIQTYVFVLNDESQYQRACKLGVSGIMTDYPSKLQRFLQSNPL